MIPKRFSLFALIIGVTVVSLLFAYAGSYYRLSRRGLAEAAEMGMEGFLYDSAERVSATEDLSIQHRRRFYYPFNIDDVSIMRRRIGSITMFLEVPRR